MKKKTLKRRKKKKKIVPKIEGVKKPASGFSLSSKAIFKPKIKVIGIGGGGGAIVSEISKFLKKATFAVADTDIRSIKRRGGIKYFYFGEALTKGLGTGMDPDLAKTVAEKEKERITGLIKGHDIVILVASLGGGLGSGAAPFFAQISRNLGIPILGIFTTPFKFEGKKKAKISQISIQKLKEYLNAIIIISNDRIFKIIDERTSITEAFSVINRKLIELLESLVELIYNPGLINIDFADMRTILRGRGMTAFLNTVEFSGKTRAEQTSKKIFFNPLFNCNIKAEKILFNISGSDNLSMFEVEKISQSVANLNPRAKIIFGISKKQKLKNKIRTTVFATGFLSTSVKPKNKEKKPSSVSTFAKATADKETMEGREEKKQNKKNFLKKSKKQQKKNIIFKKRKKRKKGKKILSRPEKTPIPIVIEVLSDKPKSKKEMIRRNALEIKKAQEMEEHKRLKQESQWEIPAFLRRAKSKT